MNIKELAEQAGVTFDSLGASYTSGTLPDLLERFADLVRRDEREACAKLCESKLQQTPYGGLVAEAIRARSKHD